MNKPPFYLTTTLPYVNADPHIGFALEIVHADIIARFKEQCGYDVFFNTGTDEHGLKIYRKALEMRQDPQEYVDAYAAKFRDLQGALGLSDKLTFIRTTDLHHKHAAQALWQRCAANGDIYKREYQVKYCVGCELEKTDSELEAGSCPLHLTTPIELIEEENYFFRFSRYQEPLLAWYREHPDFVIPDFRFTEIKRFVERGLEDFSISRLKGKMPWGVPVPDDPEQVMYVWFDALVNYISTTGWPGNTAQFERFWPGIQFAGKDNLRQQSAMWQAMLMSAGLPPSKHIVIHGFITSGGQKMSKSIGNVVDPYALVAEFGTDALRYYLARHIHPFEDSDFTTERFLEAYNAHLANGIGNLTARIMKMAEQHLPRPVSVPTDDTLPEAFVAALEQFQIQQAADIIWEHIGTLDARIQETQPFKLVKEDRTAAVAIIEELVIQLRAIATMLAPILPETARKIKAAVRSNTMPEPLFVRR